MAVPVGPGHRFGYLGQAAEGLTIPGEALFQDHDPLEPAVPFAHEQRASLQTQALARLGRAAIEGSAESSSPERRILRIDLSRSPKASDWSRYASTLIRSQRERWAGASPPKWARH